MSTLIFIAALMTAQTPVEKGVVCADLQPQLEAWIVKRLDGVHSRRWRKIVARQLSKAIVIESTRHNLDPLVMATIAWIESDYQPNTRGTYRDKRGRRAGEVGVWQLIPGDSPVRIANKGILGCELNPRTYKWIKRVWRRRYEGQQCKAPDIGALRLKAGRWSMNELRDLRIGTYIAASEMRLHIDHAVARRPKGHRWPQMSWIRRWAKRNPNVDQIALERYCHFNWGSKERPKHHYRWKLLRRYSIVRDNVCGVQVQHAAKTTSPPRAEGRQRNNGNGQQGHTARQPRARPGPEKHAKRHGRL